VVRGSALIELVPWCRCRRQLRQMAEKYLESIYSSPDGLQICFEKLLASTTPTVNSLVRFACLKGVETIVLQRYSSLDLDLDVDVALPLSLSFADRLPLS